MHRRHPTLRRDPARYLGFVEVRIEQGPVLFEMGLPLGVVTSINGSVRYRGRIVGMASHAGTTPWTAGARAPPRRAGPVSGTARGAAIVGTMGMLDVPNGSINVVPRRMPPAWTCARPAAPSALATDVLAELAAICQRRGLRCELEETLRAAAAPAWQSARGCAVAGLPVHHPCPAAPATTP